MTNLIKLKHLQRTLLGLVLLGIVVLAPYPFSRGSRGYASVPTSAVEVEKGYSTDLDKLRRTFNEDKSRVRLLLLLSPS